MATASGVRAGKSFVEMSLEDKTQRQLKVTEQNLKSFANSVDAMSTQLGAFGAASLTAFGYFTKQASDARETLNKFNAVFGSFSGNANQFATDFGKRIGRDVNNLRDGMAAMDALIVGVGVQRDQASDMVKELTTGAVDFGSFFNTSDEESFQRFLSALSGSVEVMDQFGINLKQAAINNELVAQGFPTIAEGATEAQKVIARYSIIMQTLGRIEATGDAARTAGEFANMLKRQKAEIKTISVEIGNALLPAIKALQAASIPYLQSLREWVETNPEVIEQLAGISVAAATAAAGLVGVSVAVKGYAALRGGLLAIEAVTMAAMLATQQHTGAMNAASAARVLELETSATNATTKAMETAAYKALTTVRTQDIYTLIGQTGASQRASAAAWAEAQSHTANATAINAATAARAAHNAAVARQVAAQTAAASTARMLTASLVGLMIGAPLAVWVANSSDAVQELNRELKKAVELADQLSQVQASRFNKNLQGKSAAELQTQLDQLQKEKEGQRQAIELAQREVDQRTFALEDLYNRPETVYNNVTDMVMPGERDVSLRQLQDAQDRHAALADQERQLIAAINEAQDNARNAEVEAAEKAAEVKAEASKAEQKAAEEAQRKLHALKLRDAAELALREGNPEQQALALDAAAAALEEFDQPLADLYRNLAAIAAQQAGAGVQSQAAAGLNDNLFAQALGNDNDPALKRQYAQAGVQLAKAQGNSLAEAFFQAIIDGLDEQEQQLAEVADLPTFDPAEIAAQANSGLEVGTREAVRALAEAFAPRGGQTHDQQMEGLTKQLLTEAKETNKLLDDQLQNPAIVIGQV